MTKNDNNSINEFSPCCCASAVSQYNDINRYGLIVVWYILIHAMMTGFDNCVYKVVDVSLGRYIWGFFLYLPKNGEII